jgi:YidC/Oxa1 family membrane protein insertase
MSSAFNLFLYQPLFNLLVLIYVYMPGQDMGLAIIVLTILVKLLLYPFSKKSIKSQKELQEIQPKLNELKEKYKDNKDELGKATLNLYRENKINPLSSCLPVIIQLPFFIAIFRVLQRGLSQDSLALLYKFTPRPEFLRTEFLGLIDLSKPNIVFALLAAVSQFIQAKMLSSKRPEIKDKGARDEDFAAILNKQTLYIMPVLTLFIGIRFPSGLALYWFVSTLITILQQVYMFKFSSKVKTAGLDNI